MGYTIYHIPGIKIGCSKRVEKRIKEQGYNNFEILEVHTDIKIASQREHQLQKQYGYRIDKGYYCNIDYSTPGIKGGKIGGKAKKGDTRNMETKIHNGKKAQSIVYTCPHCNTEMKGTPYFRYHGDRCKYV